MHFLSTHVRHIPEIYGAEWFGRKQILASAAHGNAIFWIELREISPSHLRQNIGRRFIPSYSNLDFWSGSESKIFSGDALLDHHSVDLGPFKTGRIPKFSDFRLDDAVIFPNNGGIKIYGHWLLDIIPSIFAIKRIFGRSVPVFIDSNFPDWVRHLLNRFELDFTQDTPAGNNFILSGLPRYHDYLNKDIFDNFKFETSRLPALIDKFDKPDVKKTSKRKIFLSRAGLNLDRRKLINSQEIMDFFDSAGFEIIFPENLSIHEQVKIFSQTSILAGEAGSALHNSIFCGENTTVINLQSSRQSHFIQSSLCNAFRQRCIYVFGKSETNEWNSNFSIDLKDCKEALNQI